MIGQVNFTRGFVRKIHLPALGFEPTSYLLMSSSCSMNFLTGICISQIDQFALNGSKNSRDLAEFMKITTGVIGNRVGEQLLQLQS